MKKYTPWILLIALIVSGSFWGWQYVVQDDNVQYVYADETDGISAAVASASTGDLVKLGIGTFSENKITVASGDIIYFRGEHRNATKISASDSLFDGAGTVYIENMTLEATATGNIFDQSSGLAVHLTNCNLTFRFCNFTDSVWVDNSEFTSFTADSFYVSTKFFEFENFRVNDVPISFSRASTDTAIGTLTNGYVDSDAQALHFTGTTGYCDVRIDGGFFRSSSTTLYVCGLAGYVNVSVYGATFYGGGSTAGGATFYAHDTNDDDSTLTAKIVLSSCRFYNPHNRDKLNTDFAINISTADTVDITGCIGNSRVAIDSCETADINLGAPIVYWAANWFGGASLDFGNADIDANLIGTGTTDANIMLGGIDFWDALDQVNNDADPFRIINAGSNKFRLQDDGQGTIGNPWLTTSQFMIGNGGTLWIVDATGADSARIYDDGTNFVIRPENTLAIDSEVNYAADAQGDDDYEVDIPGITALHEGLTVTFKANTANTDGATLEITSVGDIDVIAKMKDQVLATNDIKAGQIVTVVFDGGFWQMTSQIAQ